jgi:SpoVK/Ycf46/Vps4 family AAA+-type ATPase
MEFASMTGASFSKFADGKDIEVMDKLFEWARGQSGVVLFIDEADALLSERKAGDITSEHYKRVSNFLNHIGDRSGHFMLVFSTNYPERLDSALLDRIDDQIEIKLPGLIERIAILTLYRDSILLDRKHMSSDFIDSVTTNLSYNKLVSIAQQTVEFSGRELFGIINKLKIMADISDNGLVSSALIDSVVKRFIDKHQQMQSGFAKDTIL